MSISINLNDAYDIQLLLGRTAVLELNVHMYLLNSPQQNL